MVVFFHVSSRFWLYRIQLSCLFFIDFLNFFVSLSMSFNPRLTYKKYPINTRCPIKCSKIRKKSRETLFTFKLSSAELFSI